MPLVTQSPAPGGEAAVCPHGDLEGLRPGRSSHSLIQDPRSSLTSATPPCARERAAQILAGSVNASKVTASSFVMTESGDACELIGGSILPDLGSSP
eukprot:7380166-Prymnesium_polylepis.1